MSYDYRGIDRLLHSPIRFAVMALLANEQRSSFTSIRESVGATEGNLATHIRKLEEASYVTVEKRFEGRKPHTEYSITDLGRTAFGRYLEQLQRMASSTSNDGAAAAHKNDRRIL